MDLEEISKIIKKNDSKIIYLVMDGLGGHPINNNGLTELETAKTPNLDELCKKSICGLQIPVGSGITPGSGPGHLGLFGYDPLKYKVGRGVLAALGIGFDLNPGDIAARGNFATIEKGGIVKDRRAGRIPTEKNKELCKIINEEVSLGNTKFFVETVKEHRFLLVLRDDDLSSDVIDTDPQQVGRKIIEPKALDLKADKTVEILKYFLDQVRDALTDEHPSNFVLLRGFSKKPNWPSFPDVFGLKSAAIAAYPMYRGLAKLIGMDIIDTAEKIEDEFKTLKNNWDEFDFFFLHVKKTDSYGEDGNFDSKVKIIEKTDSMIPELLDLDPDVIVVTGDHSTPAFLKSHSWHPVPAMIYSKQCRPDNVKSFNERACLSGGLGPRLPAVELMPIAMANALKLDKYGA